MITLGLRLLFSRAGFYGLCGIALISALGWYTFHERSIGAEKDRLKIETQDKESKHDADEAERLVRACITTGRVWNNQSGQCDWR